MTHPQLQFVIRARHPQQRHRSIVPLTMSANVTSGGDYANARNVIEIRRPRDRAECGTSCVHARFVA